MDETLKSLLEKLYEECKHGDEEHQQWLKDKIMDFAARYPEYKVVHPDMIDNDNDQIVDEEFAAIWRKKFGTQDENKIQNK